MTVLGISCWYHDAAAVLLRDGQILAAAQEERFTRIKHDPEFPANAVAFCLAEGGITTADLDAVAFYDKPLQTFERLLETYLTTAPRGLRSFIRSMPVWLKRKLWIPGLIRSELGDYDGPLFFSEHHESHAASAFFPSPFERAAFLTTDGVGEWTTTSWGTASGNQLRIHAELHFPHSLGLLYSAFTTFCGFRVNSGEYKLMGLAPYGEPRYVDAIREHLIDLKPDGSYRLNQAYFDYAAGLAMTNQRFADLFGGPARVPEGELTQREMDLARSVQIVTEDAVLAMARHIHAETGEPNLCMAGGVALNCVANGRLLREGPFARLWVQPAAGDAGGALGAALMAYHHGFEGPRQVDPDDSMRGAALGPAFSDEVIRAVLVDAGLPFEAFDTDAALVDRVAKLLAEGQTVGCFQGRAEFGPRALGNRSILADPRGREVQRKVNLQIKFRESFRPFAPSVLAERAADYFDLGGARGDVESPYMLLVGAVRDAAIGGAGLDRRQQIESAIPAVTHVDGSARVQTVSAERNGLFYDLVAAFEAQTGCPVLVNTSFNVRGEPIVHAPEDALRVFRRTHMDALAIGRFVVTKAAFPDSAQDVFSAEEIAATYGLD